MSAHPATARPAAEAGFSLVEVVVSMTLFSIVLLGLAGLTATAARRASRVSHLTTTGQVMTQQVNRIGVLPYDSLVLGTTCETVNSNGFAYTRCMRVDSLQAKVKQITLTMTPSNSSIKPVIEIFRRTKPAGNNVLNR